MSEFTSESLPLAVKALFEVNNYEVYGPKKIHGAEIDLVATSKSDPVAAIVYIEVTIEYVDNDKYGKDVGKLALLDKKDPGCRKLIISSSGFSLPVIERANETGIQTFTYTDLYNKFQKFGTYTEKWLGKSEDAQMLKNLLSIYETPLFFDHYGKEDAVSYLYDWKKDENKNKKWLVIVGEYGTGKTALTRVIHEKWLQEYVSNPSEPLPLRIELKDFTRQFDDRSLLHHFLDTNDLAHVSIDFVYHLLRNNKIILILDGYDEMAQYMHARERRACLEALASLASLGAKGILTSRPNYFTESEELQLIDTLYKSIERENLFVGKDTEEALEKEAKLDALLNSQFIDRYERILSDLTEIQTESLVKRTLKDKPNSVEIILSILRRVLRTNEDGSSISLGGKPVIISYLLDVVETIDINTTEADTFSEWYVYDLIITNLMKRDLRRSPDILPAKRRLFLQVLAIWLSSKGNQVIDEEGFFELINKQFDLELRRAGDQRRQEEERLFADLRSSSTLTRGSSGKRFGWRFSHNSLREFLVAEYIVMQLESQTLSNYEVPISEPMRHFVKSLGEKKLNTLLVRIAENWANRIIQKRALGVALNLLWNGLLLLPEISRDASTLIAKISSKKLNMDDIALDHLSFSSGENKKISDVSFTGSELSFVDFSNIELNTCDFSNSSLEMVNFQGSALIGTNFSRSFIIDVNFTNATLIDTMFTNIEKGNISIIIGKEILTGFAALGYLKYVGATVSYVPSKYVFANHPKYSIMEKIIEKLSEQSKRQIRGLTQRGEARQDPVFARNFISFLIRNDFLEKARLELTSPTPKGRELFTNFLNSEEIPEILVRYLETTA